MRKVCAYLADITILYTAARVHTGCSKSDVTARTHERTRGSSVSSEKT